MKNNWKKCLVQNLGEIKTGKTPRTTIKENYGGKIPFLTPSDDMSKKHIYSTLKYITERGLTEVKNCLIPKDSICVSCIGSDLGKVVVTTCPTITNQQINSIVINQELYNVDFCYYLMKLLGRKLNYYSKTSTAVPIVNKSTFSKYEISVPPLETQQKIAKVLSAFDDKIELNNKINENLEQQAQAIFNNYFPNINLGNKVIGNYIKIKKGKNLLSKDAVYGKVPVVAGGLQPSTYHNIANTLSPVITISASGANAGYVNLWNNPVWSSDSSFIDNSITPNIYFWFVLLKRRQQEIYDSQTGSAQPHIYPQHIEKLSLIDVDKELMCKYDKLVTPLFNLIGNNKVENEKLANLRDTLLPKLMSGEIDVENVDMKI